jgi:polysaccharide biosynthesis protein PelD
VSDPPASPTDPGPARRSRWSSMLRIAFEFALMFGIAMLAKQVLVAVSNGSYPNPLWLPVIVLSLQHGLGAGLAAATIAAGLQYWGGLPPALMTEDMYGYIGRVAAEPVGWTCVALLIGHIRSQQIAQNLELEAELAERSQHSAAVAALCVDLRSRAEMLERYIAANAQSSNIDVAEAITALQHATWEDFADRLTRFVILMTGAAEFSVYLLRDDALKLAFQPTDEHRPAAEIVVPPDDPLFAAIVHERRTLSAARPADHALLGERGILAGPLVDQNTSDRVIGMFAIGGASLDDTPEDIERRFSLTCSEIARLAGRISLIDSWHAAAAPSRSNGHAAEHPDAAPEPEPAPAAPASGADSTSSRLQAERPTRPDPVLPDNEFTLQ